LIAFAEKDKIENAILDLLDKTEAARRRGSPAADHH
jgi:hypothetical protein